jgi:hypothetical protein
MRPGTHRLFPLVVVALVAAATAVPLAPAAGGSPDDRPLSRATSLSPASVGPDDRSFYRGTSSALAATGISPDDRPFDRSAAGLGSAPAPNEAGLGSFDRVDAAVVGIALALLGAAALLVAHQRRSALRTT